MGRHGDEIKIMRRAGRVVAEMHDAIRRALVPGVSTLDLDRIGREVIAKRGATSNFLGYHGYPAVICASPNDVVVHGIPNDTKLQEGDIVSIDCGAIVDGYHGDAAFTAGVGAIDEDAARLIETTRVALDAGIGMMEADNRLGDLGWAVQSVAETAGYTVVEGYTGHGIGTAMHEPPDVPNQGRPGKGRRIRVGDVFAIEPMVCAGRADTVVAEDGWTVLTVDGSWAAHWEHTVAVTDNGPEILTLP
ncbi:MAG TPA: type I methionyl aminopeptidase [Acidimicrobiales bacterium]|jgi:methionyl aminopeptidase